MEKIETTETQAQIDPPTSFHFTNDAPTVSIIANLTMEYNICNIDSIVIPSKDRHNRGDPNDVNQLMKSLIEFISNKKQTLITIIMPPAPRMIRLFTDHGFKPLSKFNMWFLNLGLVLESGLESES